MGVYTWNPDNSLDVKAGISVFQGQLQLQSKFRASVGYIKPYLHTQSKHHDTCQKMFLYQLKLQVLNRAPEQYQNFLYKLEISKINLEKS